MKYAVEVASCGSINKAAESLYMDQSNLSRCIKDLEASLGVNLFERSSRGIKVTPRGEEFLKYAKSILKQVDTVENMFRGNLSENKKFSVSVPRASYISDAFSSFIGKLPDEDKFEFFYKETNSLRAIKNILESDYRLGIIRYAEQYDAYYKDLLDAKGLAYELVTEFRYRLLVSKNSPLATVNDVKFSDLPDKTEIAHADPYVPFLSLAEVKKRNCRRPKGVFSFLNGRASSNCSPKTRVPLCGCPPFPHPRSRVTDWSKRRAPRTKKSIKTFLFTKKITPLPISIRRSLPSCAA